MLAYIGAWAGLIGGIGALFILAEEASTPQTKRLISNWLLNLKLEGTSSTWPAQFAEMFDSIFGKKNFTIKCFLRSSIASFCVALVSFLVLNALVFDISFSKELQRYPVSSFVFLYLTAPIVMNLFPDYFSLLETRFIIRVMGTDFRLIHVLALLGFDLFLTTLIWFAGVNILFLIFLAEYILTVDNVTHPSIIEYYKIAFNSYKSTDISSGTDLFAWISLITTFFTSFWIWLYASSGFFVKLMYKMGWGFNLLRGFLDVKKKPVRALGFITCLVVTILFFVCAPFYFA